LAPLRQTKKKQSHRPIPRRLLAHLRCWHPLGQRYPVEFNGGPVKDVDKAFRCNIEHAGLHAKTTGLDGVSPHILRHTAATWLMQAGTDLWEAAGYLGMSVQTLLDRYGHHHPDYLSGGLKAFDQPPLHCHRNGRNKREQNGTSVAKIADYSREGQ
jgi:integrase